MNKKEEEKLSKFLSLILRHSPGKFGVILDEDGFCKVNDLISSINSQNGWSGVTLEDIQQVVKNCPKQRYLLDGDKIKANYGHSAIKVKYENKMPPKFLYHGTNTKVEGLILKDGIKSMNREYVHLSEGLEFATLAGSRRGELSIIKIDAGSAYNDGIEFYYAENEVWLCNFIPAKYLSLEVN